MYEIGKITTTHGIKGEVRILNLSDFDRFIKGEKCFIIVDEKRIDLEIETVRPHKNLLIVKFKEFNNINEVINFRGLTIYTDEKGTLEEDEFYYEDLLNLKVYTLNEEYVGVVSSLYEVPQGHLIEVEKDGKKTLIPFVKAFVKKVDDEKIIIDPIEGLL